MLCFVQMLYDVGQILGGFTGGYISDKMGVRSPVIVAMLLLSWYGPSFLTVQVSDGLNDRVSVC